jgi:nucleotide-binding universal stress UspA family protein
MLRTARAGSVVRVMHHTVLVAPPPGRGGRDALALGVQLARPFGAEIVLAGALGPADDQSAADVLRRRLDELRASAPGDLPMSVETVAAPSILRGLHDLACAHEAQVLALGPSHRTLITRALGRDPAADAVFTAPCAVAVARRSQATSAPRRIGVAWDESAESNEALEWAVQLAERTGGNLLILRVVEPLPHPGHQSYDETDERLQTVRRAADQRVTTDAQILRGAPAAKLAEATRELDVLVTGSRGRGPMRRTRLGSVSTKLAHDARCAVVVLPRGVHAPFDAVAV